VRFAKLVIPVVKSVFIYVTCFVWQPHSLIYFDARSFNCKYSFSEAQFVIFEFHKKKGRIHDQLNNHTKINYENYERVKEMILRKQCETTARDNRQLMLLTGCQGGPKACGRHGQVNNLEPFQKDTLQNFFGLGKG
jgi:hypothetical protein